MNEKIQELKPVLNTAFDNKTLESLKQTAALLGKRVGGGPVQVGIMSFKDMAEIMINAKSGFDSKNRKNWENKEDALRRIFGEYSYPIFDNADNAILLAVVRKYMVDPEDGFISLAPGTIDIEATFIPGKELHRELQVLGIPGNADPEFAKAIMNLVGITSEYGNKGDSMEFVVPLYTPGIWHCIKDVEKAKDERLLNRKTGVIIMTPYLALYSECKEDGKLTINNLQPVPDKLLSVKTREAIKAMREVYKECNLS